MSRHGTHYGLLLLFALAAWSPQVLDTLGVISFSLDNVTAFIICVLGNLYYFSSISMFFKHMGPGSGGAGGWPTLSGILRGSLNYL